MLSWHQNLQMISQNIGDFNLYWKPKNVYGSFQVQCFILRKITAWGVACYSAYESLYCVEL